MSKSAHIIQKQFLEVEFRNRSMDTRLPEKLKQVYYGKLLPGLEALFDRHGGNHTLVRIEELSVETILVNEENWEEELVSSALHQVELRLRQGAKLMDAQEEDWEYPSQAPLPVEGNPAAMFCHFIRLGRLPWYAGKYSLEEMERQVIAYLEEGEKKKTGFRESLLAKLIPLLSASGSAVQRLIRQHSDRFLQQLFSKNSGYRELRERLKDLPSAAIPGQRIYFWNAVIRSVLVENSRPLPVPEAREAVLQTYLQQFSARQLEELFALLPPAAVRALKTAAGPGLQTETAGIGSPGPANLRDAKEEKTKDSARLVPGNDPDEGVYVDNAGLVILHPFLEQFFREIKLADEKGFIDTEAHQRAVLLTQYLVTPQQELPEYELLLNKILCGYPAEETLSATLEITPAENSEINDLLQTVVDNWKVREVPVNTTVDNLRVSFLQRPGKLTRRTNDWLLQVEQKGFDIVIDSLPWGIGMIKNSWMPEMLRVEWTG